MKWVLGMLQPPARDVQVGSTSYDFMAMGMTGRFHGQLGDFHRLDGDIPSGKHTKNYGKSQSLIGKSTINGSFSIAMLVYQRVIGIIMR